jgi:H+/Cl- antiporter ClcA
MLVGFRKSVSDLFTDGTLAFRNGTFLIEEDFADREDFPKIRADNWGENDLEVGRNAFLYALACAVLSLLAITLPIVAGVFTPTIAVGAGLGRCVGEIIR